MGRRGGPCRLTGSQEVTGSIPVGSTNESRDLRAREPRHRALQTAARTVLPTSQREADRPAGSALLSPSG